MDRFHQRRRLGWLVCSAAMTYALIQLGREIAGDAVGSATGIVVSATALYAVTSVAFGWSVMLFGLAQALRSLRGSLDLVTGPDGLRIEVAFPVPRQNISERTGTPLNTVSRLLSAWEKEGLVRSTRRHIVVTAPHRLVLLSGAAG